MPRSPKAALPEPSDLELQILATLWRRGPSTAREVMDDLPDEKQRAYTSVLSVLQVMQKKGLVKVVDRRGLANVFQHAVTQKQTLTPMFRAMVKRIFAGSPAAAMQQLLDADTVTDHELAEMRRLLDEAEHKRSNQ
ncbi:MAG: BlaI/MecI/CopY family transcriptional regulator [Phycisphaeraceae bacterium]|nr:MAG: BlaI/MecI/CopY family transcriptional regulator [Phycisphaeraceae bacterium]